MSVLETFQFPATGHTVRTVVRDGEPWFVARDVCAVLGIANASDAVGRLDEDGVGSTDLIDSMGRAQRAAIVNEPGLYELIFQSRRPEAKAFRRWVTAEVLPAIRKTGRYETAPAPQVPQTYAQALRAAADADEAREAAEKRAAELEPRAESWDALASADGDYLVRDAAKVLSRDPMISIGERRLFGYMEHLRWIYRQPSDRRWRAYQAQVDTGRLVERAMSRPDPDGGDRHIEAPQVRITPKGLHELRQRLNGADPLPIKGVA